MKVTYKRDWTHTRRGANCAHEIGSGILAAMELVRLGVAWVAHFGLLHFVEHLAELELGMGPVLVVPEFTDL